MSRDSDVSDSHCQTDAVTRAAAELSPVKWVANGLAPNHPQISSDKGAAVAETVAGLSPAELAPNGLDTVAMDSRTADDVGSPAPPLPPSLRQWDDPSTSSDSIDVQALRGHDDLGDSSSTELSGFSSHESPNVSDAADAWRDTYLPGAYSDVS